MTKFNIGDRVKDVSVSAPVNPYGIVHAIDSIDDDFIQVRWEHHSITGATNYIGGFHHASDFILVESTTTKIEPWNLMQVSIHNKEKFKEVLLNILHEGRTLTPMEVVKVEDFLGIV